MLQFPLRLTAGLVRARLTPGVCPIQFVDAADILHHGANHPVSHDKVRELNSSRSPVVWIGGSEPLDHPGVSHLVRAITQNGHFVFLETDGTLLRRRIHEFQPVPRLFLTVRLKSDAAGRHAKDPRASAFELAAEGIRTARLSGFFLCVHAKVQADTELAEMAGWVQFAQSLDVDGLVISPANQLSSSSGADAILAQQKTAQARHLIPSRWWRSLSRLIEPVLANEPSTVEKAEPQTGHRQEDSHANEEGVGVA
jgi:hypothetical protein